MTERCELCAKCGNAQAAEGYCTNCVKKFQDAVKLAAKVRGYFQDRWGKTPERISFRSWVTNPKECLPHVWMGTSVENARFYWRIAELLKRPAKVNFLSIEPLLGPMPDLPLEGIHWVIVGGESGEGFRPLNLDWVRQIRDRCIEHGVKFFFKQKSAFHPKSLDRLLDGREWNEFPE